MFFLNSLILSSENFTCGYAHSNTGLDNCEVCFTQRSLRIWETQFGTLVSRDDECFVSWFVFDSHQRHEISCFCIWWLAIMDRMASKCSKGKHPTSGCRPWRRRSVLEFPIT